MRDAVAIQAEIVEGINKERLARGLRRLLPDDALAKAALAHTERAARLGKFDAPWLETQLALDNARWRMYEPRYFLTDSVPKVVTSDVAMSEVYDSFGVGVVQAPLDSKAVGALWITLICGGC